MQHINDMIHKSILRMRRTMKKLGCKMKVAYQQDEEGKISTIKIEFAYESDHDSEMESM